MKRENIALQKKYQITARFYDLLDYFWERQYRLFRPHLLKKVQGNVLEAGVGTGRNFCHYSPLVTMTGIDLSSNMLRIAQKRADKADCKISLFHDDATQLKNIPSNHFDWYVSFFMFCVMPNELQELAVQEMVRVLKPCGNFILLEMIYSRNANLLRRQNIFGPFVEKVYGARFDRQTLKQCQENENVKIEKTYFVKDDVYLVIEGSRRKS